jgi:hypothetical protein
MYKMDDKRNYWESSVWALMENPLSDAGQLLPTLPQIFTKQETG